VRRSSVATYPLPFGFSQRKESKHGKSVCAKKVNGAIFIIADGIEIFLKMQITEPLKLNQHDKT